MPASDFNSSHSRPLHDPPSSYHLNTGRLAIYQIVMSFEFFTTPSCFHPLIVLSMMMKKHFKFKPITFSEMFGQFIEIRNIINILYTCTIFPISCFLSLIVLSIKTCYCISLNSFRHTFHLVLFDRRACHFLMGSWVQGL